MRTARRPAVVPEAPGIAGRESARQSAQKGVPNREDGIGTKTTKSYLNIGPVVLAVLLLYGIGEKGASQIIRVPEDQETLAAAIAAASAGDTIVVSAGRFTGDVTIEKPVTIAGRGQRRTTITGSDDVLTVKADLTLRGLTIVSGANCVFVGPGDRLTMTQCTVAGAQPSARHESAKQIRLQTTIYNEGATRCLEMSPRNNFLIRNWYAD